MLTFESDVVIQLSYYNLLCKHNYLCIGLTIGHLPHSRSFSNILFNSIVIGGTVINLSILLFVRFGINGSVRNVKIFEYAARDEFRVVRFYTVKFREHYLYLHVHHASFRYARNQ